MNIDDPRHVVAFYETLGKIVELSTVVMVWQHIIFTGWVQ